LNCWSCSRSCTTNNSCLLSRTACCTGSRSASPGTGFRRRRTGLGSSGYGYLTMKVTIVEVKGRSYANGLILKTLTFTSRCHGYTTWKSTSDSTDHSEVTPWVPVAISNPQFIQFNSINWL
jgi:hypothetical protein